MAGLTGDGAPKDLRDAVDEEEAVRLANEGARRVFCPRCERGHEGPCTGPESTRVDPATDDVSRETSEALRRERRSAYLDGVMDEHHPDL